ncbi:MAG TPA: nitronate monooxygenase [Thermohalobaculum sp.]|nr:nitronate monooxygenase [Thermohalobaculum sp.]
MCGLLACRHPVIQAAMGGVARAEPAAAVSEAGAFGCLGMVREAPALIEREIAAVREATDRPFGQRSEPLACRRQHALDQHQRASVRGAAGRLS